MQVSSVTDQDVAAPTLVEAGFLDIPAGRTQTGRFAPGHSGNPMGRTKESGSLSALIKSETLDGRELVMAALRMLRNARQDPKYRLQALEWLADRGWGKAVQAHEVMGEGGGAVVFTLRLGERSDDGD